MSTDEVHRPRRCVGGPFDGEWIGFGAGSSWPITREDGSVAWYRADLEDDSQALYSGAAPPTSHDPSLELRETLEDEANAEELEREQDSAT